MISGGLAHATVEQLLGDPTTIPRVHTGHKLRIIGQALFLAAIFAAYAALLFVVRRAGRKGKYRTPLWWMAASAPFLLLRGAYGVISSADWKFSYYLPSNVSELLPISNIRLTWISMVRTASTNLNSSLNI